MCYLCLANLLADLAHEGPMQLAPELGGFELLAILGLSIGIFAFQVVEDVVERAPSTQSFVMLGAILATIHFGLVLRNHGLGIVVALQPDSNSRHVTVHQVVVST